ncbi:MAG: hypothetical protein ACW975_11955 [Candidatus Thorarchaeota archaeon]|jgi:uncharacterized membrane protein YuzA (DUF378 family)
MSDKPMGVLILALLQLLSALAWLAMGVLALMAFGFDPIALLLGGFFSFIFIIVGIIGLILFYGLWTTKGWAWLWTLIINLLGILGGIGDFMGNIIPLAISIVIVVYLLLPGTRSHFV